MYSGYGGSPSRAVSTMSLSVRPSRRIVSRSITRSQSFAGVNSYDKPYRSLSVFSTPGCTRKASNRGSRMFTLSAKSQPPKVPQPERLDEVYEALKRGLQSYLQVHQMELDSLSRQMKESKRNSRLGFLYELDKQVKVIERFMRRLEFHQSKIDELYDAYCMQRRLRDGANKMVKAYTGSSGSREARESLSEANKGFKEYTENMCMLENELENQLGEFHIKMKGLAGFARLCAGDQYEIFMKYGRQRWKLRGRIEINGKQVWDSEEMVFLPLITEFLSIKVTEIKSLANHVVVGSVSCETKDLFAALPQTVAVDINDLGTIKLSLEVTWNPFDKDDQASSASTVNKPPSVNKRFSTYNQSPPDTPSLREQAFYNMLRRQEDMENGTAWSNSSESSDDSSSPQLSLGLRHTNKNVVQPEVQAAAPAIEISFAPRESATSTPTRLANQKEEVEEEEEETVKAKVGAVAAVAATTAAAAATVDAGKTEVPNGHTRYSRSLSHISESSVDGALTDRSTGESVEPSDVTSVASAVSVNDIVMEMPVKTEPATTVAVSQDGSTTSEPENSSNEPLSSSDEVPGEQEDSEVCSLTTASEEAQLPKQEFPSEPVSEVDSEVSSKVISEETQSIDSSPETEASAQQGDSVESSAPYQEPEAMVVRAHVAVVEAEEPGPVVEAKPMDSEAEEALDIGLDEALAAVISSLDDYRGQFPELQVLEQELKQLEQALSGRSHSRSSSVSLTVETALESFDFLNTSDLEEEEDDEEEGGRQSGPDSERHGAPERPADESAGEDEGCEARCWDTPSAPLSTACLSLDHTLLVHLKNCSSQLLRLGTFGPLRCGEMYALDRLLREARVLELIRRVAKDTSEGMNQPEEVVPQLDQCQGAVVLWKQCMDDSSERSTVYSTSTETILHALSTTYSSRLPERAASLADSVFLRLVERMLERRLPRRGGGAAREMITLFQFWSYLEAEGVIDLDTHVTELAEEVWLVQCLQCGDQDTLVKALKRPPESSLKREGLRAVSLLLRDPRGKVCSAASSLLRSLADQPRHRERALVSCLELLEDESLETRVCGCKALACLKAKESIDQLVYLCRTDKEDVRDAAKQALLVLGEEGKMAHRHVESSQDGVARLFAPGSMASTAF
ncbi:rho family-interacting cell polarization regulator 1 isoform X4 [Clupea harengus]|uniref:Rho family-interacting cell polarization regulator 1 isoform X4 n=1 Tax=Clupea harengus TaxID=7950 RepID=A0A6P8EVG0_CLUHA|nr:rho family-interacting cell polarization regulator 1 isoform X4 [Clupea harengus]